MHFLLKQDITKSALEQEKDSGNSTTRKYEGTVEVEFEKLVMPTKDYMVRPLNEEHIYNLEIKLLAAGNGILSSMITVMRQAEDKFMVIDGNHRFQAMANIKKSKHPDWFKTVTAVVYVDMTPGHAVTLGVGLNLDTQTSLCMTDYEIVESIRKIFKENASMDETEVNKLFRATTVGSN